MAGAPRGTAGGPRGRAGGAGAGSRDDLVPLLPPLRAYARSLIRDPGAADDLVQDAVVLALQAWDRFEPGTNLKAWLFRILHNRFRSVVTRKHAKVEVGVDDLSELAWVPARQEAGPEVAEFRRAFARLPPSHREALVLFAVHGMSLEQIAAVCGCKVQAVKSRMNRARAKLRAMLLGEGGTAEECVAFPAPSRPCGDDPSPTTGGCVRSRQNEGKRMSRVDQLADYAAIRALIPELRGAARGLVDGAASSPDDLVRGALVAALRDRHRQPPGTDPRPWLLGILADRARMIADPGLVEQDRAKQLGAPFAKRG